MSSIFKKNLHLCFFKIKCLPSSLSPPLTLDDDDDNDDINYLNISNNNNNNDTFNSICDLYTPSSTTSTTTSSSSSSVADFPTVFASQRFFVSSPGCSNSILDSCTAISTVGGKGKTVVGGGVPVKKYSPDPYVDFRRSMHEMIEAREREKDEDGDETSEWEFLNELLLCYLKLNPKHNHKYIIAAFSDVLVSVLSSATATATAGQSKSETQFQIFDGKMFLV